MSETPKPAVFFDRDNTLIVADGYLGDPGGVTLVEGAAAAVARAKRLGYAVVVISNQSGVARGLFDENAVHAVNARMCELLRESEVDAEIDRHEFCPFHPDAVVEAYRQDSDLRKPKPGMLFRAAAEMGLDLQGSWLIGDAPRDVEAGRVAGTRTILLRQPDLAPSPAAGATNFSPPDFEAWSLKQAMDIIEAQGAAEPPNVAATADETDEPAAAEVAPEADVTEEAQAVFAPEADAEGEDNSPAADEASEEDEESVVEAEAVETVSEAPSESETVPPSEEPAAEAKEEEHWPADTALEPPAEAPAEMVEPPVAADPDPPPAKQAETPAAPAEAPAPVVPAASYAGASETEDDNAPVGLTFPSLRPPANRPTPEPALKETTRALATEAPAARSAEEPATTVTNSSLVGKAATLAVLQAAAAKKAGRKAVRPAETIESEPSAAAPTATVDRPIESGSGRSDRLEALMEQVLTELRRRNVQGPGDFSVTKMLAGVVQIMALVPLFYAYFNWMTPTTIPALLVGQFLQTLTISLYVMSRR